MFEIVLPSMGSLCVAIIALLSAIFQGWFFLKKPRFSWNGWGALISLCSSIFSFAIFIQYNRPPAHINFLVEMIQNVVIIIILHSAFGFYFSYNKLSSRGYHQIAGLFHALVIILGCSTNLFIRDDFAYRNFLFLKEPYIEPQIGPLGFLSVAYVSVAGIFLLRLWIRAKKRKNELSYANFHLITLLSIYPLGIHDALASLGYFKPPQFLLEYGLLLFSLSVLVIASKQYMGLYEVSEERRVYLENVLESVSNAVVTINNHNRITEWNMGAKKLFGYSRDEAIGDNIDDLITAPDVLEEAVGFTRMVLSGRKVPPTETIRYSKDGTPVNVVVSGSPITMEDGLIRIVVVYTDITEQKKTEKKIKKSLEEKKFLLKEVHHRVKNNMGVIVSLINLQSRQIKDKKSLEMFKAIQRSIYSMALVHEILYKTDDFSAVDFRRYIQEISNHLIISFRDKIGKVKLKKDIKNVFIDINKAVPLGLIINELITNSLKYAFPDKSEGEIKIEFYKEGNTFNLTVSDNGVGFPEDLDFSKAEHIGGVYLVNLLVKQIDGEIELDRSKGTSIEINFNK